MACGTFQRTVSAADLNETQQLFQAANPTTLTTTKNADGTYTVTAVFPPCPPDTTHVNAGASPG